MLARCLTTHDRAINDPYPSPEPADKPRTLPERLTDLISPEPESRAELLEILQNAYARNLIDTDSLSMTEGIFQVSDPCARDIMIPRAQMDALNIANAPSEFIPFIQKATRSRFPVYEGSRDNIIGVLLAKGLLRFYTDEDFDVRDMLRPAVFIPESKQLNMLLRDFRVSRNHIVIVVNEYGGVAGLITIGDVPEQTVGDVEDECDFDQEEDNILPTADGHTRVHDLAEASRFNEAFGTHFSDEDVDAVGGLLPNCLGHVPHRGERVVMGTLQSNILHVDAYQVQVLLVRRLITPAGGNAIADTSGSHPT